MSRPIRIAHVVHAFDTGGLENGVVNLINRLPVDEFEHVVVALTQCAPAFCARVQREGVRFIDLDKGPGHGFKLYPKLYRLFRALAPDIVHTRNLAALEASLPAALAGVKVRIHGEHGWDTSDPEGLSPKYRFLRKLYKPFVTRYIALSGHLARYLTDAIHVAPERIVRICNGVDSERFHPATDPFPAIQGLPFSRSDVFLIGTVGRLQAVKDQLTLVSAFAELCAMAPEHSAHARLVIAGEGPLRSSLEAAIQSLGLGDRVWLAGERADVPAVMQALDVFVLPSQAEGISNTILEAMACGLPVVATDVGGNAELVDAGQTGMLVPAKSPSEIAHALLAYIEHPLMRVRHGEAGRQRVEATFSLEAMVSRYRAVYRDAVEAVQSSSSRLARHHGRP